MTNKLNNWFILPTLLGAAALSFFANSYFIGLLISLLSLLSIFVPKIKLDKIGQIIFTAFIGAFSYVIFFTLSDPDATINPLKMGALSAMFLMFFLGTSTKRLLIEKPLLRTEGSGAILLFAFLSMGSLKFSMPVLAFMVSGFFLTFYAVKKNQTFWPKKKNRRSTTVTIISFFTTTAIALFFIWYIPIAYQRAMDRYFNKLWETTTAFSNVFTLGEMQGMLNSQSKVMRIYGSKKDIIYFRGKVYDRYTKGSWNSSISLNNKEINTENLSPSNNIVDVNIIGGLRKNIFLPLNASNVKSEAGRENVNIYGIVTPELSKKTSRYFYNESKKISSKSPHALSVAAPSLIDTHVPSYVKDELFKISSKWTADAVTNKEKISALKKALNINNQYSQNFIRKKGTDPVIDFLTTNTAGHCEYFSSAFALLARSQNIPVRVVTGYMVSEYNSLGDYHIARKRNAHSWNEVYIDGTGWITFDPTPPSTLMYKSGTLSSILDIVPAYFQIALDRLANLKKQTIIIIVLSLVAFWIGVRFIRKLRLKKRANLSNFTLDYKNPPVEILQMFKKLKKMGHPHLKSEPILDYAKKLQEAGPKEQDASKIITRYIHWRFGKSDSFHSIKNEILAWLSK